jgi:hypothetical protein
LLGLANGTGSYTYDTGYGGLSVTGSKHGSGTWEWTGNGVANVGGRHYCATSQCSTSNSKCTSNPTGTNGGYCHCQRMSVGDYSSAGSWVFHYSHGSASDCSSLCASHCGYCALYGAVGSCSRSTLLAL